MHTDGNTDAINRHLAEREAYDEQQDMDAELQDLRDEVDTLTEKLAGMRTRAEAAEAMLPRAYRAGVEEGRQQQRASVTAGR